MRFFFSIYLIFGVILTPVLHAKTWTLQSNSGTPLLLTTYQYMREGDTLQLNGGVYKLAPFSIEKKIVMIGVANPVFDAETKDEAIRVLASGTVIDGITVKNTAIGSMKDYAGIRVSQCNHVSIKNCKLINTFFGIYINDASDVTIENCQSSGANYGKSNTGNGIHLWKSLRINISKCYMHGHRDGIYLEFAKLCHLKNNLCEKNFRYGLHFMFSDSDTYIANTFRKNGTGVAVMYSKFIYMKNNRFENNWGDASYGMLLKDISDSKIIGNRYINNTIGVTMEGSNRIQFISNTLKKNGYALRVWANCYNDTFINNVFSGNTFDASTNGELSGNFFNRNYWDKYEGYDLNRDKIGDIPYYPVSMYSMMVQQVPYSVFLMRSLMVAILDRAEKSMPTVIPSAFKDVNPLMKPTHD